MDWCVSTYPASRRLKSNAEKHIGSNADRMKGKIMLTKITLVVALCANLSTQQIQSKMQDLQSHNPNSKVTVRFDQKAKCEKGEIIQKVKSE